MRDFFRKNGIKLAVTVLLVAVFVSVGAYLRSGRSSLAQNATGAVRAPIQRAVSGMASWLEGIYGYIYKYDQVVEENNALKSQLAEAQQELRLAVDANEENARLRELIGLREKHADFVFESAKIINWEISNFSSVFTLSKGETSGLDLGQCVVTEYGALVGEVIELGDSWAKVRTVVDIDMDIGALVGEAGNAAIVEGDFTLMQKGLTKLSYLTEGRMSAGEVILTSGKGGKFPQGLEIGRILSVETEASGLMSYGIVEPSCDLNTLSQVFVIKEFDMAE